MFKLICTKCNREVDLKRTFKKYCISGPDPKLTKIKIDINHDGAIVDVVCKCGNKIKLL